MEKLKEELAKKRKFLEEKKLVTDNKRFFKREELIRKSEEDYWRKQEEKRRKKLNVENNREQEQAAQDEESFVGKTPEEIATLKLKKIIANQSLEKDKKADSQERVLPRNEVIRRLRSRDQPILLFGESEIEAFRRLRKLEIQEPETSKGYTNDFQEAMEKVDAAYLEEIVKSGGSSNTDKDKKRGAHDVKIEEINTTIDEILEQAQYLGRQRSRKQISEDDQRKSDCDVIAKFLKFLLELWGKKLNERSEEVKRSTPGKNDIAIYIQTRSYLKPLFKQLNKSTIADDILKHLILIIKYMLERNYVKASDAYLQMAIGNAPWPIGVTMVGIHARTGREKIFAQNIAHVLNDETQRKYIQALKRLMTQCQKMFPTDPSKCVEYTKE